MHPRFVCSLVLGSTALAGPLAPAASQRYCMSDGHWQSKAVWLYCCLTWCRARRKQQVHGAAGGWGRGRRLCTVCEATEEHVPHSHRSGAQGLAGKPPHAILTKPSCGICREAGHRGSSCMQVPLPYICVTPCVKDLLGYCTLCTG